MTLLHCHLALLAVLVAVTPCWAAETKEPVSEQKKENDEILKRVAALQKIARASNHGTLGCGVGFVTLVTSKGEVKIRCGLDSIHVFGGKIKVSDIHVLLRSRADSNLTGEKGAMSGEVSDLCYVCLSTLSLARDPESIPIITPLLEDKNDVVRGWAAISLFKIAEADAELKKQIEKVGFPRPALASAGGRGIQPPPWVIVKSNEVEPID